MSRGAGSRVPAPATSTRRATSSWSRPNGTTHTGTPAASAFCVAPAPPWVIAHAARSRIGACGTKRSTRALAGTLPAGSSAEGSVATTCDVLVGERLERGA